MKILVLSDTHSYLKNAEAVLRQIGGRMDAVFHLGDHDEDAVFLQKEFPQVPFHYVRGNNDFCMDTPWEKLVRLGGKRLLLTHGNRQRVYNGLDTISYRAEEQEADVVCFGHTHRPLWQERGRVALFNPGSISVPRGGTLPTFGILTIENGRVEGAIMEYWDETHYKRLD